MLPHEFTLPFVIFAVSFPLMACQDFARFIGISRYDPAYAIWLDLAWLVLFLIAYVVLKEQGLTTLAWLFGAWSGAGALVGLWTLRAHFARTRQSELLRFWDTSERGVGLRFAGQFMLVTSWTYFVSYLLLFVLPLASIGVFKLSQLALGPITVLLAGVQSALIALATKRFQLDTHKAVRFLLIAGVGSFAADDGVDRASSTAHPPTSWRACSAATGRGPGRSCPTPGWRSRSPASPIPPSRGCAPCGLPAENLRLSVVMVPFLFLFCLGGAELYGTRGAAGGLAIAGAVYSGLAWWVLVKVARAFVPGVSEVVADPVAEVSEP